MSTGEFSHPHCNFRFPENWTLDQSSETGELQVTVESPNGGFWTLQDFGPEDPVNVAEQARDAMLAEYEQLESREVDDDRFELPMFGYDLDFYCLDLVIESHIRTLRVNERAYLIMYQAEDRAFQDLTPVFAAITKTLVDSLVAD